LLVFDAVVAEALLRPIEGSEAERARAEPYIYSSVIAMSLPRATQLQVQSLPVYAEKPVLLFEFFHFIFCSGVHGVKLLQVFFIARVQGDKLCVKVAIRMSSDLSCGPADVARVVQTTLIEILKREGHHEVITSRV